MVQRHSAIAAVFGLAAIAVWLLLRRPGGDRRALRPLRWSSGLLALQGAVGGVQWALELPAGARLAPRRPRDRHLAGDALDGRDGGPAGAARRASPSPSRGAESAEPPPATPG